MARVERRLVVTVCPREPGVAVLPVERGGRAVRLDAVAILDRLRALVTGRGLDDRVRLREGCAGGCSAEGPNVSVEIFPLTPPGERPDHVAIGWKTYVYSLSTLDCLATILDENLARPPVRGERPRQGSARPVPAACPRTPRASWSPAATGRAVADLVVERPLPGPLSPDGGRRGGVRASRRA